MREIVTEPNTSEPLHVMMAAVEKPLLETISTRAQGIISVSSELVKSGELYLPDTSCHQHVPEEARGESLCLEDNKYPSNQIGSQKPANSAEADKAMFDKITSLYENDESTSRSLSEDSEVSENQLRQQEQRWFHQNLEYIIGRLLQEWQGSKKQTHDQHFGKSNYNEKTIHRQTTNGLKIHKREKNTLKQMTRNLPQVRPPSQDAREVQETIV